MFMWRCCEAGESSPPLLLLMLEASVDAGYGGVDEEGVEVGSSKSEDEDVEDL